MKVLNCKSCKGFLGEIEKGRIRSNAVLLCHECGIKINTEIMRAAARDFSNNRKSDYLSDAMESFQKIMEGRK